MDSELNIPKKPKLSNEQLKEFQFSLSKNEFDQLISNSVKDKHDKPLRYLVGNFMNIFNENVSLVENRLVELQKRNNTLYEETCRSSTCFLRINAECKCCPKDSRVKYTFVVHNKPKDDAIHVVVDALRKGSHVSELNTLLTSNQQASPIEPTLTRLVLDDFEAPSPNETRNSRYNRNKLAAKRLLSLAKRRKPHANVINSVEHGTDDITRLVTKMSDKIMVKLDQINLKLNQLNDRMYVLERKFELLEEP